MYAVEVSKAFWIDTGYGSTAEDHMVMIKFDLEKQLIEWIEQNPTKKYTAYKITPLKVITEVKFEVKEC